jgi:hypothetical protein
MNMSLPRKIKPAFMFFVMDEKKVDEKTVSYYQELGQRWNDIRNTQEGEKYKEMNRKDKKRYDKEMKIYRRNMENYLDEFKTQSFRVDDE